MTWAGEGRSINRWKNKKILFPVLLQKLHGPCLSPFHPHNKILTASMCSHRLLLDGNPLGDNGTQSIIRHTHIINGDVRVISIGHCSGVLGIFSCAGNLFTVQVRISHLRNSTFKSRTVTTCWTWVFRLTKQSPARFVSMNLFESRSFFHKCRKLWELSSRNDDEENWIGETLNDEWGMVQSATHLFPANSNALKNWMTRGWSLPLESWRSVTALRPSI